MPYLFPGPSKPELIIEPGISIVGDVMKFVGKIIGIKTIRSRRVALVTGSVHNVKPTHTKIKMPMHVFHNDKQMNSQEIDGEVDVCGYTCMEHDCLYERYQGSIAADDYVVFDNVGAYTTVLKPPFINPSPPIIMYDTATDNYQLIKKQERFDEVFSSYSM